jgi:hypothetical protein
MYQSYLSCENSVFNEPQRTQRAQRKRRLKQRISQLFRAAISMFSLQKDYFFILTLRPLRPLRFVYPKKPIYAGIHEDL